MIDRDRVKKLRQSSTNIRKQVAESLFTVGPFDSRFGDPKTHLHFRRDPKLNGRIDLKIEAAGNPGMTIASLESQLRLGPWVSFSQTALSSISFSNGQTINPLFEQMPPNLVNYYPTMIPDLGPMVRLAPIISQLGGA